MLINKKKVKEKRIIEEEFSKNKGNINNMRIPNTPMVNGYRILKDPEPIPGEIDPVPIMIWGEIASTPQVLRTEKKFTVPSTPTREFLAHHLTNKNQAKKFKEVNDNNNKKKKNQTIFKSNLNTYELTPSAMKLLSSVRRNHSNIFETPKISKGGSSGLNSSLLNKKRLLSVSKSSVISVINEISGTTTPNINK